MPYDSFGNYYDDGRPAEPGAPVQPRRKTASLSGSRLKATLALIIINVICYFASLFIPDRLYVRLAMSVSSLDLGMWWTIATSMFLHSGFSHIFNNMVSLLFVGSRIEPKMGPYRYIAIYILSGIAGAFMYYAIHKITGDNSLVVGASGAIFGLFGAYGYLIYKNHMLHGRNDGTPITEIQLAVYGFFIIENIVYGLADSSIANSAHLGGLICGFILCKFFVEDGEI